MENKTELTEELLKQLMDDLTNIKSNEFREFVVLVGKGYHKQNRNTTTGKFEKGKTYIKGSYDYFEETLKKRI